MTVAVCEDDKNLLQLIQLIISDLDIQVLTCTDDISLREIMANNKVDLLVIDYWLKKVKADDVIKEIQSSHPNLPIILMSAIANLSEVKEQLKVSDYLRKPFDIDIFKSKVINYINNDTQNRNY
jgi:DNA-binding NtrC family response regulator